MEEQLEEKKSKIRWTSFIVDIESTGPIPGDYNMHEFSAVKFDRALNKVFHTKLRPICRGNDENALKAIGKTWREIKKDPHNVDPKLAMTNFKSWILRNTDEGTKPMFISDNNGFDFMFMHWYFMHFLGKDPFGYTSRNIADIFGGLNKDMRLAFNFKKLRKTKHTHNPIDDVMGNAEALLQIVDVFELEGLL
jgi:hypothetical protein